MTDDSTNPPVKQCSKCGDVLPPDGFSKGKATCKACRAAAQRARRIADPEREKEIHRRCWAKNLEKYHQRSREYRERNAEAIKQKQALYYQAHRDEFREYHRVYRREHAQEIYESHKRYAMEKAEEIRQYQKAHYHKSRAKHRMYYQRRRADKRGHPATFTEQEWQRCLDYWGHVCAVCQRPQGLFHRIVADHWIPLRDSNCPGTVAENLVPLCHGVDGCNNSKRASSPDVWLRKKFGARKAAQIERRVREYFEQLTR